MNLIKLKLNNAFIFCLFKFFSKLNIRKDTKVKFVNLENGLDYLAITLFFIAIGLRYVDEERDVYKYAR
jgi:hypothetical protein